MTREEAIEELYMIVENQYRSVEKDKEAINMAIKALEQEPCDDLEREYKKNKALFHKMVDENDAINRQIDKITELIEKLPPVTPTHKKGKWEQYGNYWEDKFKCSECGKEQPKILCGERIIGHWSDYCPNCGAKMEVEE